ncbi:hypothetical protein NIES4102_03420 [Chondrocystis sp. NIES-4102]|nr:hypothetical protein NIES4102_03420 [Chondrocystis sp. NIES-4102]
MRRIWSYFSIIGIVAIAIVLLNYQPLRSQVIPPQFIAQVQPDVIDLEQFSRQVKKLETKWENDYERYFKRDFDSSSKAARKIANILADIQTKTDIKPAVIWAASQPDFLQLVLVTPGNQFISLKVKGATKANVIQRVRELETGIGDRETLRYLPPARLIYRWLIKPLEPYLEAEQIDTLLLCTGPSLRSLPFAALHDGEKFLVEKYNLANIPAFSLTDTSYEPKTEQKVLAIGASEFSKLPSLPGVEVELNTIVPKLWSGRKIINQDFTIENFKQAHQTGGFDIVHIASHSHFSPGSPNDSYIQFSDRKLSLNEIANLKLDSPPVDLLVLSACETALGNEEAEFGFAGLAMQAGVKSALASLWQINDAGTVVLMSEFYQQLKSTSIKAQALRQAQINMLRGKVFVENRQVRGSGIEVNLPANTSELETQNFNHPFYWAGFTIIGNPW